MQSKDTPLLSTQTVIQLTHYPVQHLKPFKLIWQEGLSTPFSITLHILCNTPFNPSNLLYQTLGGKVKIGEKTRPFNGIITAIQQQTQNTKNLSYEIVIKPTLALLQLNNQFNIYKNRSVINIIEDKGYPPAFTPQLGLVSQILFSQFLSHFHKFPSFMCLSIQATRSAETSKVLAFS